MYTYVKAPGGYDVFDRQGNWVGWSAGSRQDAREMMGDTGKVPIR